MENKEIYETPVIEVIQFETEDVITTSGNDLPFEPVRAVGSIDPI